MAREIVPPPQPSQEAKMNPQQKYEIITSESGKAAFIAKQVKNGKTEAEAQAALATESRKLRTRALKASLGI
jgi:hypothetical protein